MAQLGKKTKQKYDLYWSQEKHLEWLKLYSEHCEKHGEPVFTDVRPTQSKYQLNVMCCVIQKLLGDAKVRVLEIGSYRGESTTIFNGHFHHVTAVDPFGYLNRHSEVDDMVEENESQDDAMDVKVKTADENELIRFLFEHNVADILPNIDFHRLTSDDYFEIHRDTKFDFIYVDGDHRYSQQMRDYTNAMNSIEENGIIGGHDFSWESTQKVIKDLGWHEKPVLHFMDDSFLIVPEDLL